MLAELERFEPFRRLAEHNRRMLERALVCKDAPRATPILHKGQPVSGAYLVLEGRLRVFTITPGGTEATLYFIGPGETCVLSLNCLFNDLLYPAWVQAETASRVLLIPGPAYRQLFESEPSIRQLTVQTLSLLVTRLITELEQLHASSHKQRLAQFILLHATTDGCLLVTQQQLARHLGTTREVIARLMQDFVAQEYVQTQRGQIRIRDLFGLRRVLGPR